MTRGKSDSAFKPNFTDSFCGYIKYSDITKKKKRDKTINMSLFIHFIYIIIYLFVYFLFFINDAPILFLKILIFYSTIIKEHFYILKKFSLSFNR